MEVVEMKLNHMDKLYHSLNPLVRYIHVKRLRIIKALVADNKGKILDCGCGEGHLLRELSGDKHGMDYSPLALRKAQERNPKATILEGDITNLPFDDNSFDVVVCSEVLEHVLDYKTSVSEIIRVTRKGGRIIISVPNERNWTIGRLAILRFPIKIKEHVNSFTPSQLIEIFGSKPKRVIYIPFNSFTFALTQIYEFEKVT